MDTSVLCEISGDKRTLYFMRDDESGDYIITDERDLDDGAAIWLNKNEAKTLAAAITSFFGTTPPSKKKPRKGSRQ